MRIQASRCVINPDDVQDEVILDLNPRSSEKLVNRIPDSVAFLPLINAHDHLVGNWVPKAGDNRPYPNSHIWVEDMKGSLSFTERSKFWLNDGSFDLASAPALTMAQLGAYKSLFSGCGIVQDHAPLQEKSYYDAMPIIVTRHYRQCHSLNLGNWWGDESPEKELELSGGIMPFIIHLGEGIDEITKAEFAQLEKEDLLRENTMMIHGIAFTQAQIRRIAEKGATVCWCPDSNYYLIGKTFDIDSAFKYKANVVIGTDSTMSGAHNLIGEFALIRQKFPHISPKEIYRMVTVNAVKALYLSKDYAELNPQDTQNLLLIDQKTEDPFENLMKLEMAEIKLLIVDGIPRYGDSIYLEEFPDLKGTYSKFSCGDREKFVIGDPQGINRQIDAALGYHKDFPYLPF